MDAPTLDYCRQIEAYLCRKNDGHLIRVVGPSFDLVSGWAARGVPLTIACAGIDRAFERYHRKGPRRRPIKIDFCDADVLDVFEEWQRAVGIAVGRAETSGTSGRTSLPAHLTRVVRRLSEARAAGAIGQRFDRIIDAISCELDRTRSSRQGVRGAERQTLIDRLAALDGELVEAAYAELDGPALEALAAAAAAELATFRERMVPEAYERARAAAEQRLVRERLGLPTVSV